MLICPMCKKELAEWSSECPRCRADLSILVDYVSHLQDGLVRADELTRQGELGEAVWAYLEVLEVDPDNARARQQISKVATAVRQFDRAAIGRRWLQRLQRQARFRRWLASWQEGSSSLNWPIILAGLALLILSLLVGYGLGRLGAVREHATAPSVLVQERAKP
jgi:hypothetical protein